MNECDNCSFYLTDSGLFEKWGYCSVLNKERKWDDARGIGCPFFHKRRYGEKRGKKA